MANTVVELNQLNDTSLASKSSRPHAAVELVPVHNPCDEKIKEAAQKCNHFSIRGYVSEVRKRDPKRCYPFTLKESTDSLNELPPMVVPNFRWWRCNSCVPEDKNHLPKDSCRAGNEEAQNGVNADASIFLVGQSSKVDNAARLGNTETCTSIDSNDNKNYPVSADLKGKGKAHANDEIPISSGCENGFLKVSLSQGIPQQTSVQLKVVPFVDNEVERRSRCNQTGTTEALHKDCRAGRAEVGPSQGYVTRDVNYVAKNYQEEPQTCLQHQPSDSPTNTGAGIVKLPDLNECNGEPLFEVNTEATVTGKNNNQFFEDDDDYLGAERRKKPKVRLLSELLSLKETHNPSKGKKKIISSASSKDEYIKQKRAVRTSEISESEYGSDSDDVSTEKISNAKGHCKSRDQLEKRNKKIKVDHADSSSLLQQKIKSKSSPEKKNSSEESPQNLDSDDATKKISNAKRHCKSKDQLEKRKKIKMDHADSSLLLQQKIKSKSSQEKINPSEELPQNLDFLNWRSDKNSVLTKKRGKVSPAKKESTSHIPSKSRMPEECQSTQIVGDADQNATENVRKTSDNGLYLLNSYLNKENDLLCDPRKDGPILSSSQAEQMPVAGNSLQKDKDNRNIGETGVTPKPTVTCAAALTGNQSDGVNTICPTENSGAKKTRIPEADRCSPLAQHMPMQVSNSTVNHKDLTNEVRGRIQDIDINSIPTDDKTNEQGLGDDIPMDIVELMAKNQYERHLDDPKDKHVIYGPPDLSGAYVKQNGTYASYGQHVQMFAQSQFFSITKPPSTDPRYPMFNENSGHCAYYNSNHAGVRGLPRENMVPRFLSPSQTQEHIRSYSSRGLTPKTWNENLNATIAQRYPSSFLQQVDSCQKPRAVAPRPSITDCHHVWPPSMASRMPLGITNPHMISQRSDFLNKGRIHPQSPGSFLNFNPTAASSSLEKQKNLNFSSAYNSGNPENSARSVDVNEAIPAMHLLSLMQNAAKSQNTELSLGPQKMVGPTTSSRYPFSQTNSIPAAVSLNSGHPCYPTTRPTARPFPLAYQNDSGNISRNSAPFMGHIPLTLQGQRNMENSHFARPNGDHRPLRRPMAPPHEKRKGVASKSKTAYIHNPLSSIKVSSNLQSGVVVRCNDKTVSLAPDKVICRLNQNPSEFNDLRLISKYMIGPDDLKPRKRVRERAPRQRGNPKRQNIKVNKPIPPIIAAKS